jgi:two-component system cell cycle sensor histidine kinase/response regulator CckA
MNSEIHSVFGAGQPRPHWMLVDDNEDVLRLLPLLIKKLSEVEVECFSSPQSALTAFAAAPGKYELVISDFEMPDMNGVELCRRLRTIAPAQKIFLATGLEFFTEAAARHAGFNALLPKPFPLTALQEALAANGLPIKINCSI